MTEIEINYLEKIIDEIEILEKKKRKFNGKLKISIDYKLLKLYKQKSKLSNNPYDNYIFFSLYSSIGNSFEIEDENFYIYHGVALENLRKIPEKIREDIHNKLLIPCLYNLFASLYNDDFSKNKNNFIIEAFNCVMKIPKKEIKYIKEFEVNAHVILERLAINNLEYKLKKEEEIHIFEEAIDYLEIINKNYQSFDSYKNLGNLYDSYSFCTVKV